MICTPGSLCVRAFYWVNSELQPKWRWSTARYMKVDFKKHPFCYKLEPCTEHYSFTFLRSMAIENIKQCMILTIYICNIASFGLFVRKKICSTAVTTYCCACWMTTGAQSGCVLCVCQRRHYTKLLTLLVFDHVVSVCVLSPMAAWRTQNSSPVALASLPSQVAAALSDCERHPATLQPNSCATPLPKQRNIFLLNTQLPRHLTK